MIPFLTEIYGFSYHYTANAPTLQEIFIIFLCRHAPFSAGKPARPERRAPGRPGKRTLPGAAGRESRRAGFAPRSRKRIPYTYTAETDAIRVCFRIHFHRNPLAAKSKRPASRAFRAAERRSAPCQAIQSHTPQSACKALPAGRVQSPFQNRSGIVYIPRFVLSCAITKEDMPHFSFSRRSSKPPLRIANGKGFGSPTHTACRSDSTFPIARLETEALSPALPYGSAGETPPTRPCAAAQGRVGGGRAIEARRTSETHHRNTPRRCGRRGEEPFRSAAEPFRRHRR